MTKEFFGVTPDGKNAYKYELKVENSTLTLSDYGARVLGFKVNGCDIVTGFDTLSDYVADIYNLGATVGRVANRIKNAELKIDGKTYHLTKNNNGNCLHGGIGIQREVWELFSHSENEITFRLISPDGNNGFPGELHVFATYTLLGLGFAVSYRAVASEKTAISLASHPYFCLDGYENNARLHLVKIYAERYTEVDKTLIPTGKRPWVDNTPYDFREFKRLTENLDGDFKEYDTNFILSPVEYKDFGVKTLSLAAEVMGKSLKLKVYTDQKCIQLYTPAYGGVLPILKGGVSRVDYGAFCFETQIEPNSVNLGEGIYGKNEVYKHSCVYEIEVIDK